MSAATDTIQKGIDNFRSNMEQPPTLIDRSCLNMLIELKSMVEHAERETQRPVGDPGKAHLIASLAQRINAAGQVSVRHKPGYFDVPGEYGMPADRMYSGCDTIELHFLPRPVEPLKASEEEEKFVRYARDYRESLMRSMGIPAGLVPCSLAEQAGIDRVIATAQREGASILEHDRQSCPDCCMGLTGWLPCERHK